MGKYITLLIIVFWMTFTIKIMLKAMSISTRKLCKVFKLSEEIGEYKKPKNIFKSLICLCITLIIMVLILFMMFFIAYALMYFYLKLKKIPISNNNSINVNHIQFSILKVDSFLYKL